MRETGRIKTKGKCLAKCLRKTWQCCIISGDSTSSSGTPTYGTSRARRQSGPPPQGGGGGGGNQHSYLIRIS